MRDGSRKRSRRGVRPRSTTPSIGTAKAPREKSSRLSRARLATCLRPARMRRSLFGYLFLLQRLLEHLRYRTDRGYADAARLIADFQADVVAQVEAGDVDGRMLAFVGGALHQSKIPASPELAAASARQPVDQERGRTASGRRPRRSRRHPRSLRRRSVHGRRLADRKRSCHAGRSPQCSGRCLGARG